MIVGLRSLVIDGWDLGAIAVTALVIVDMGAILTGLSLRVIAAYDRCACRCSSAGRGSRRATAGDRPGRSTAGHR